MRGISLNWEARNVKIERKFTTQETQAIWKSKLYIPYEPLPNFFPTIEDTLPSPPINIFTQFKLPWADKRNSTMIDNVGVNLIPSLPYPSIENVDVIQFPENKFADWPHNYPKIIPEPLPLPQDAEVNEENWWYVDHLDYLDTWNDEHPDLDMREHVGRSYIYGENPFQPVEEETYGYGSYRKSFAGMTYDRHWPWVWTEDLDWLFSYGYDSKSIWLYSPVAGQIWTSEDHYPWVYSAQEQTWLYSLPIDGRAGCVLFNPDKGIVQFDFSKDTTSD